MGFIFPLQYIGDSTKNATNNPFESITFPFFKHRNDRYKQ